MSEIFDESMKKTYDLLNAGAEFISEKKYDESIKKCIESMCVIVPKNSKFEVSLHIFTILGDAYFLKKDYESSRLTFLYAIHGPGNVGFGY